MEQLEKITMDRLVRRGVATNYHHAYIRDLVNSYTSCVNSMVQLHIRDFHKTSGFLR